MFAARKTVNSVLSTFTKAIDDLTKIGSDRDAEAKVIQEKINILDQSHAEAVMESARAKTAADKLAAFVRDLTGETIEDDKVVKIDKAG